MTSASIPPGYRLIKDGKATLAVKDPYAEALLKQGIARPERLLSKLDAHVVCHRGRGAAPAVPLEGLPGQQMIIRKCFRGGMLRFINADIFVGSSRPFRELAVAVRAAGCGIPTAETLAAISLREGGPLCRCYLISKKLSGCADLATHLATERRRSPESFLRAKRTLLCRAAGIIRSMHENGLYHGDLNIKNILVEAEHPDKLYVIDWDKSFFKNRLSRAARSSNVRRFCRSMAKHAAQGLPLNERDRLCFLLAYWQSRTKARRDLLRLRLALALRPWSWKSPA